MKRKSTAGRDSDSESAGSMELDSQNEGNETPEEEYSEESDGEGRDPDQEEVLSQQDEGSVADAASADEGEPVEETEGAADENMSVVSGEDEEAEDDESDHDSVSLNSMDTVELENATRKKKEAQEALRNREFSQLYLPVGGIFDHALVQGLPIDEEEYKRQQQAFFNGDTAAERTTTRNTPVNVIEALDRELRHSKPPVTVDMLVAKYNVIKLVIKRRIDHLRAHGHSTPGIRYDNAVYDDTEGTRIVRNTSSDRLYHDIQFRDPPMTVKDMALLYKVTVHALHAKIYGMRNKGIVTNGICAATTGRGRPRKPDVPYDTNTSTTYNNYNTNYTTSAYERPLTTIDKNSRVLKYFTPEEDTKLVSAILHNVEHGVRVDWNAMDALLQRSRGAAKQRWLKTLERRVGAEVRMCLSNRLAGLYTGLYKPVQGESSGDGSDGASSDVGGIGDGEGNVDNSTAINDNTNSDNGSSMDLDTTILKAITSRLEVSAVLRAVVEAVQTHSDTFPHATITVSPYHTAYTTPTTYYAHYDGTTNTTATTDSAHTNTITNTNTSTNANANTNTNTTLRRNPRLPSTLTSERSTRNIIPTTAARESYNTTQTSRRAFTEADDILIISTVLEHRQAGVGRFWTTLDAQLQRHVMAAKGRWQRVLEPMVNERIAVSKFSGGSGSSGGSSGGGGLYGMYCCEGRIKSECVDEDSVVKAVLDTMIHVVDTSTTDNTTSTDHANDNSNTTTTATNPFTPAEDELILSKVSEWETSNNYAWTALDTELNRPPFSALVRYKTALCKAPVHIVQPKAMEPLSFTPSSGSNTNGSVYNNSNGSNRYPRERVRSTYTRLELMLMYNAHWTRTINTTPLVLGQGGDVVVSTVLEHILTVTVATATTVSDDNSAPVRRNTIGRPRKYPNYTTNTTTTSNTNTTNNTNTTTNTTETTNTTNTTTTTSTHTTEPANHRLRRFTAEEDAFVEKTIREAKESGQSVSWSALDRALGRSTGAVRQRWKKVLNNEY